MPNTSLQLLSLQEFLFGAVVAMLVLLGVSIAARTSDERHVYVLAWLFKAGMAFGYIFFLLDYYGGGDTLVYHAAGIQFAGILGQIGPLSYLISYLGPGGSNTTHMIGLSGLIHALTGDSFVASSLVYAALGFAGQVLLYQAFVAQYPDPRLRRWWQIGILFFPSLTFWSAGMLKDTLGIFGLGLAVWGMERVLRQASARSVAVTLLGVFVIYLFRAEMLPVLLVALLPWLLRATDARRLVDRMGVSSWSRPQRRLLRLALLLAIPIGIVLFLQAYPRYALSNLPSTLVVQGQVYQQLTGNAAVTTDTSWKGILLAWPSAMILTLFRPFPWEAHGISALAAALENLILLLLIARAVRDAAADREALRRALRAPLFQVCVIFILLFGIAVGVTTPNLGSANRYRIPVIPFLVGALVILEYERLTVLAGRRQFTGQRPRPLVLPSQSAG